MFGHNLPGIYLALDGIRCCGKTIQSRLVLKQEGNWIILPAGENEQLTNNFI